jgi:hypothetical protein
MSRRTAARKRGRRVALTLLLLSVSVVAAACGSATPRTTTGTTSESANFTNALNFARCMRQHGVARFPDPRNPGGFSTQALSALGMTSPQFVSAQRTCQRVLPNDGQPTPAQLDQTVKNGLKFARCMRAHGVLFPDPGISGTQITLNLADVNTASPRYITAGHICEVHPGS